jgi:hypothetical protein
MGVDVGVVQVTELSSSTKRKAGARLAHSVVVSNFKKGSFPRIERLALI